jgi:hypothetical protein
MFESLFELLLAMCAELFGEFLLDLAVAALSDLALRAIAKVFETFRFENTLLASISYALLGASAGGLSLLILPHRLVNSSRFHGINLLLSPILTGLAMSLIGSMLSRYGQKVTRIESFRYGFAVAFGIALVRFLFVS